MQTAFDILRPWLKNEQPNAAGEVSFHCPMHDDHVPSASYNIQKQVWYCQQCQRGGPVSQMVDFILANPDLDPPKGGGGSRSVQFNGASSEHKGDLNEGQVAGWHAALLINDPVLQEFIDRRGIERTTLQDFQIGWHSGMQCYTIPVRDIEGELLNCRFYQMDNERRKIWSVPGRGTPVLYPGHLLSYIRDMVVICEGEWDALITIQNGFDAVTRTGAAKTWWSEWNSHFRGKVVYICHDADEAGQDANRLVATALHGVASEVHVVNLPYEITSRHGKDLTDWWLEGHTGEDFVELLWQSATWEEAPGTGPVETIDITLLESFDASNMGDCLRTRVTITGKQNPTYIVPEVVQYKCDQQAGAKCTYCPMHEVFNGDTTTSISRDDSLVLKFLGATDKTVHDLLRAQITPIKCGRLHITTLETMSVEELYVRPSVEQYRINNAAGDYIHRKVVSVGRHDTMPNNTVEVIGTIYPSPRTQHNEFQAWQVEQTQTNVDNFEVTPELAKLLKGFQPRPLQSPLGKLMDIAGDLAVHVTQIYGRDEMHALMDLTFNSALAYNFDGKLEPRGWLDTLVVGDTRTGKTEAAKRLIAWYGAGEYVSCEAASFAGVVGGLQQYGGKEWSVTWGAVPINDRRLVVLDEVSGLTVEQIAQMSSIRSSGEAQLTKIQSERTWARTRLLWLGNPRDGKTMDRWTHGAQAIAPLIGNNEDVARFDLAMSVSEGEVSSEEINRKHPDSRQKYSEAACRAGVQWAWSRKVEDILWVKGAEDLIYALAVEMGKRYVPVPPLVQSANIRMKISRVAVALATRLFSTDKSWTKVVVTKQHVTDAVKFMDKLFNLPGFGYLQYSKDRIADEQLAVKNRQAVIAYLHTKPALAKFLREMSEFRRSDMDEVLNMPPSDANGTINKLWEWGMISRHSQAIIRITPELHSILREMQ